MFEMKLRVPSDGAGFLLLKAIKNTLFLAGLLLVAVAIFVPLSPGMPWEGLDPSWGYGMNQAVAQGLSFGKDIVFTFGPYASIFTKIYHPATDHLMIWGSLYLAVSFAIAAYLNFRSTDLWLQLALLFTLSSLMFSQDALFFFYPMLVGVQIYHWVASSKQERDFEINEILLTAVLFAPFGLLPLIKGSFSIACVAVSALSIALFARKRRWKLCILIGATPLSTLVIFWLLSGQPLTGLVDYFIGMLSAINGYTEAMAINGNPTEFILYGVATAIIIAVLLSEINGAIFDKIIVTLVFLCTLFLAFKAGFVRHDAHAVCAGTTILLAALLARTILINRGSFTLTLACLVAWIYLDATYIKTSTQSLTKNIENTFAAPWAGLQQRIKEPGALMRTFQVYVNEIGKRGAIPKLEGSADIYSFDQSYLIASGNKWNPRPVFQSYSAYTKKLVEQNKKHLASESRPENIIFKVQPIDGRLPSLEDGASWPLLLSNYGPAGFANGYLFLKNRNSPSKAYDEPKKSEGGIYSLGEQIDLPNTDAPLFLKLNIRKSFLGAIANILFKPSQLAIKLTMLNGATRDYRIIAGMVESGFLISPLVENTQELGLLFAGANYLNEKKVKSISIVAPILSFLWSKSFEVEFYPVAFESSPDFIERMGFSVPHIADITGVKDAARCDGYIDSANGVPLSNDPMKVASWLNVQGWLAYSLNPAAVPERVYLILSNVAGNHYLIDTTRTQRPDLEAYFKTPELNSSGYSTSANVSNLVGQYVLRLAYLKDREIFVCPQFHIPVEISGG